MTIFLTTLVLLGTALGCHLILWRIRVPARQTKALLMIFTIVFLASIFTPWMRRLEFPEELNIALYYVSLCMAYIITYTAIEGDSPTLSLIRHLNNHQDLRISRNDVLDFMRERPFIQARLATLLRDGLVKERGSFYVQNGRRPIFFSLILAFRRLYGRIEKGG